MITPAHNRRRGAALLIVIGLIALLLIATVAFSILMTVERDASINYRHSIQARQLLYAGLAKAIADIDANVGDNTYPPWTNGMERISNPTNANIARLVTRMTDVFQSIDTTISRTNSVCESKLLSREAMKYIPRALHRSLEIIDTIKPECLAFTPSGSDINDAVGRYAYVAVNVSGLLDANIVGNNNCTRWTGTNAGEIQLANGSPFDVTNAFFFFDDRDNIDKRYESLDELARLNTGIAAIKLSNFETFSYAPPDLDPDGNPKVSLAYDPALPGDLITQLRNKHDAITNAFGKSGIHLAMPDDTVPNDTTRLGVEWAYRSLIDYVASNGPPEGANEIEQLARPASQDAPQVQSAGLIMQYTCEVNPVDGSSFDHSLIYSFEITCSRPHINAAPASYTVTADATLYNNSTAVPWTSLLPWDDSVTIPFSETISFAAGETYKNLVFTLPNATYNVTAPSSDGLPTLNYFISARIKISDLNGNVVEQVPVPWISGDFSDLCFPVIKTFTSSEYDARWTEAVDPTINWLGTPGQNQWIVTEDDPGGPYYNFSLAYLRNTDSTVWGNLLSAAIADQSREYVTYNSTRVRLNSSGGCFSSFVLRNEAALRWLNNNTFLGVGPSRPVLPDGITLGVADTMWDSLADQKRRYVKRGPMESVGELGFLPIGRWMTINLYPHGHDNTYGLLPEKGFHPVLDYFTMRPTNNVVSRGLVNVHSRNPTVHAAVFNQMPINEWVGPVSATRLSSSDATNFGQRMIASGTGTNTLSDIGQIMQRAQDGSLVGTSLASVGELEREAVIRNSVQLYTTRQQIYTIIVRADAMTFEYGGVTQGEGDTGNPLSAGSILGSAQAVFQVWRDPVPDAEGKHPCFVRLCKILSL